MEGLGAVEGVGVLGLVDLAFGVGVSYLEDFGGGLLFRWSRMGWLGSLIGL